MLWLDTDATIAPILGSPAQRAAHRAAVAALRFPSLREIWDNAMAKMRLKPAHGGQLAHGGELANGGRHASVGVLAGGGDPVFLG